MNTVYEIIWYLRYWATCTKNSSKYFQRHNCWISRKCQWNCKGAAIKNDKGGFIHFLGSLFSDQSLINDENLKSVIQEQQTKLVEKTDLSLSIAFGAIGLLHLISTMQYFSCKQEIKKLQLENDQIKTELKLLKKWSVEIII